ncbi:MAG: hypothetical protein ABIT08_15050 [Bacteroidia bacterium]
MRFPLIKIRLLQFNRQLLSIGIIYSILIFLSVLLALYFSYNGFIKVNNAYKVTGLISGVVFFIHLSRKDLQFVHRHIEYPIQNIFAEYVLFTLPFTSLCLVTKQWYYFPVLLFEFYCTAYIHIKRIPKTYFPGLSKIIRSNNFEWLSGIRKNSIFFLAIYFLGLASSWMEIVPLVFLLILTAVVSSFYYECEPLQILFATAKNAKDLLKAKIKNHSLRLLILFAPVIIINSIFHPNMILINILFVFFQILFLLFAILLKYAAYSPNNNVKQNSILFFFAFLGSVIPYLLPLSLIMNIRNYKKAVANLNQYFYD